MNVFEEIYKNNVWGHGSGHGSFPEVTKGYRKFVENFIREHSIESIVDFGCGDWQFSRFIDWGHAHYRGYDVVDSLIDENSKKFGTKTIQFNKTPKNWQDLAEADLLLVKDVLQHLANDEVAKFLSIAKKKYKYLLITNGTNPKERTNEAIKTGDYRPLDIRQEPFSVAAQKLYGFTGPRKNIKKLNFKPSWYKDVLLVRGERP